MRRLLLVLFGLLLVSLLVVPFSAGAAAPCIAREYPQLEDWNVILWVTQWCDGSYSWEMVGIASASPDASPAGQTGPATGSTVPTNQTTVSTRARVVSP
ncbi:MAG: hypothetical protein M1337_05690 [Actinobacteria bacterium]|nr:hypothetical protein [Actinomycetota bacterium]